MSALTRVATGCACTLALSNCSWNQLDEGAQVTTTTISDEMRSVPTVPGSAPSDQDPTLVASDPDSGVPPTTALIGDPKPNVDSQATLPPLPGSSPVEGCARLADVAAADAVTAAAGATATAEKVDTSVCRFAAGGVVAEIHYVSETTVSPEWFGREGIEPVGEVGGDAVGLASYLAPGSASGDGYTIAMITRRQGAIIAVRGSAADRDLAVELALLVQATI